MYAFDQLCILCQDLLAEFEALFFLEAYEMMFDSKNNTEKK